MLTSPVRWHHAARVMKSVLFGLGCVVALVLGGCGDEVVTADEGPAVPCGEATCEASEYCCDAACGLCMPEGIACTETCGTE